MKNGSSNIIIYYDILQKKDSFQKNEFIKIIFIKYNSELYFIDKDKNTHHDKFLFEDKYSYESNFVEANEISINKSLLIEIPSSIWDKIIEDHFKKNHIILKINTWIKYELYKKTNDHYCLIDPNGLINKFIHDEKSKYDIKLNCDNITELMNKNNVVEKMRIEIPIPINVVNGNPLSQALKNLKLSFDSYASGNIDAFLNNLRNAILNDLTEYENPDARRRRRVLKKSIKEYCIEQLPANEKKDYNDILNNLGGMITSLLKTVNKFIHEDHHKVLKWPFAGDLEMIYLSISVIYRYLHRITINRLHIF